MHRGRWLRKFVLTEWLRVFCRSGVRLRCRFSTQLVQLGELSLQWLASINSTITATGRKIKKSNIKKIKVHRAKLVFRPLSLSHQKEDLAGTGRAKPSFVMTPITKHNL